MLKRMAWLVIIAAAAAGGCLTGQGAVRGRTVDHPADAPGPAAEAPAIPAPASR